MGLRAGNAIAAFAVAALTTVFSVQQGDHGPLVVYKLQVPQRAAPAAPPAANAAEPLHVVPSRGPRVLGGVTIPADTVPLLPAAHPAPSPQDQTPLAVSPAASSAPWPADGSVTLQQVSDEVMWRRKTVESLPQSPFAPRF